MLLDISIIIPSTHRSPNCPLPFMFSSEIPLYMLLFPPLSYSLTFTLIYFGLEYKFWCLLLCSVSALKFFFKSPSSSIPVSFFSNIFYRFSPLRVKDQVSKQQDKLVWFRTFHLMFVLHSKWEDRTMILKLTVVTSIMQCSADAPPQKLF